MKQKTFLSPRRTTPHHTTPKDKFAQQQLFEDKLLLWRTEKKKNGDKKILPQDLIIIRATTMVRQR